MISVFDVIGPNMVGPSSSHTAGAVSIGLLARQIFAEPIQSAKFILYGSFAKTYRGHGTDKALLGGILGFQTDDPRIRKAFRYAEEKKIRYEYAPDERTVVEHPNTVDIELTGYSGNQMRIRGESTGGGKVRIVGINGIKIEFTGEYSTLVIRQEDKPGVVAGITKCLADAGINIAYMRLFREGEDDMACTVVESDQKLPSEICGEIRKNPRICEIRMIQ